MAKSRSMSRNQNHVETPTKKRSKRTVDKGYSSPWSDLNHDVLFLVMTQLGVVNFLAFSGVCKSWRAFALSNKKTFMASRLPMLLWISNRPYKKECYLEDCEGRKYKTLLPHSGGRTCLGLTCGYLVWFGRKTCDFWLVNPITRNEFHFPNFRFAFSRGPYLVKAILVFSPIMSECVFVMIETLSPGVWFSIAGKGSWNHVSSTFGILDLYVLKGKIYTLTSDTSQCLCELRLHPEPKLLLLETKNSLGPWSKFVRSGENLYVKDSKKYVFDFRELDFGEKEWVSCEKIKEEYAFFNDSKGRHITAIKPESWAEHQPRYVVGSCSDADSMWYFPHECLDVDLVDE